MAVHSVTQVKSEYDIIFAGGGATACVTAGRLIEKDPSLEILLIEYGHHTTNVPQHDQPDGHMHVKVNPDVLHLHEGLSSLALGGQVPVVPSGKGVGGGATVGFMVYTRCAASDYDDWEKVYGNSGWGAENMIPLLKKAETYQDPVDNDAHGHDGPIKVSLAPKLVSVSEDFLNTAKLYDKERGMADDINDFQSCNKYGVGVFEPFNGQQLTPAQPPPLYRGGQGMYIDKEAKTRSDPAYHYIYNKSNPNLSILTESQVLRVTFDNGRAVGLEYQSSTSNDPDIHSVRARKLVVLTAGAFGTPAILERSGIGSSKVLKRCGIPVRVDLPGVGEHYMDHNFVYMNFVSAPEVQTDDAVFWGTNSESAVDNEAWIKAGEGLMSNLDAGIKMRPSDNEVAKMSQGFQKRWKEHFAGAPDKPLILIYLLAIHFGSRNPSLNQKHYCLGYIPAYPATSGYVHIKSKDPRSKSEFHPGYLDHPADIDVLRWSYQKCRELGRRMKNFRGEHAAGHPRFSKESDAAVVETADPFSITSPEVVYSVDDDAIIDQFTTERIRTSWHSCGTCAMKARDDGGVVDERLNVYGVEGLKIADCSIFPANVGGTIYNTALGIGEKAAILIAEDLKL